jgi:hypothetical protein
MNNELSLEELARCFECAHIMTKLNKQVLKIFFKSNFFKIFKFWQRFFSLPLELSKWLFQTLFNPKWGV